MALATSAGLIDFFLKQGHILRDQQAELRRRLGRVVELRNGHLLDTLERGGRERAQSNQEKKRPGESEPYCRCDGTDESWM